jgi:hypothetical protein
MRENSTKFYVVRLVFDYFKAIRESNAMPGNLYLDYNDSQVLVWAGIKADDEKTERNLLKAEAVANAKNYRNGFHISSTIIEDCDHLPAPPHYQKIDIHSLTR